jgi:hypothetical protein
MELVVSEQVKTMKEKGNISSQEYTRFENFLKRCNTELMKHRVITNNDYTRWFSHGEFSRDDLIHFIRQFSVFSNLFLVAQLKKVINAGSLEEMRASKEILANEIGVIFRKKKTAAQPAVDVADKDREGDPDLVSVEGTVDGGTFRFKAAHFEWLLQIGHVLGMTFPDMGKRHHGTPSTLFFCDELSRLYGSEDSSIGAGAGFAVENWAAAGFWKELIQGLDKFKKLQQPDLPLAFFTWHDKIEEQHADHVMDELEEIYFSDWFNEEKFLKGGRDMLDGVNAFWVGLNENRIARAAMKLTG